MSFLLDTNVISELRRRTRCHPKVKAWAASVQEQQSELFISVLTLGEIREGIERLRGRRPAEAMQLESWLLATMKHFGNRILPVTAEIADRWGRIASGRTLSDLDALIAATALEHDLIVVTRNVKDFQSTGVRLFNPFE